MKQPNEQRRDVSFVDSTLGVGQQLFWEGALDDEDALTVLSSLNDARFNRVEIPSPASRLASRSGVAVEDLTTWDRRCTDLAQQTTLRWFGPVTLPLVDGRCSSELGGFLLERAAAAGIREIRLGDATNGLELARASQALAAEAGVGLVAEVAFTASPRHDDAWFVAHAAQLAELGPPRLCLTDPSGLLDPERVRSLVPQLLEAAPTITWEFLGHCNNWLGPLNALAAAESGIHVLHTAIPPLASAESAPPLGVLVDNLRARDRGVRVQPDVLDRATALLRFLAKRRELPKPPPRQYSLGRLRHHLPEPHLAQLQARLRARASLDLLSRVLEEVEGIRADLGFPVVTHDLSGPVIDQAVQNVTTATRYQPLSADLLPHARRQLEQPSASVAAELQAKAAGPDATGADPQEVSLVELRAQFDAPSEPALIEQAVLGQQATQTEREARINSPVRSSSPVVRLVRDLVDGAVAGSITIERPGFSLIIDNRAPAASGREEPVLSATSSSARELPTRA